MGADSAMKAMNAAAKSHTMLMCEYCGRETFSVDSMAICTNCEGLVHLTRRVVQMKNPELANSLDTINGLLADGEHERAAQIYEKLYSETKDPQLLYAEALVYIKSSNYEMSKISYDKQGFMDGNIALKDNALKQASSAKKLLAKLIHVTRGNIDKDIISVNTLYSLFLAQLKFGDIRGARHSLEKLEGLNNGYVYTYASMVFWAAMENYGKVIEDADALMAPNNFSINAAYYMAFAYFKQKKLKDAKRLLAVAQKYLSSESAEVLIQDMEEYGTF